MKSPMKLLYRAVDWYVIKYHSHDYIRRSLIQDEITLRIDKAVEVNNNIRDLQEDAKIKSLELKFQIQENGWCAEISNYEKIIKDVYDFRNELLSFYATLEQWAQDLQNITAANEREGDIIAANLGSSVTRVKEIKINIDNIIELMHKVKNKNNKSLRVDAMPHRLEGGKI